MDNRTIDEVRRNEDRLINKIELLEKENQELKIELSGYRQAILNDKEMLGLKEQNRKYKEIIDKVIDKLQLLIDIGFDYDGFNQVNSLKTLIDELVGYAKESRNILKEVK